MGTSPFLLGRGPSWLSSAQLSSAQQGSSLVISECVTVAPPPAQIPNKFLPAPAPRAASSPRNELLLFTGHTQGQPSSSSCAGQHSHSPGMLWVLGQAQPHTLGSPQGSRPGSQREADGTKPVQSTLRPRPTQAWTGCH